MSNGKSSDELVLLWNGRPVGIIRDAVLVDWPWHGGTFEPENFPKELADFLSWRRAQPDEHEIIHDPFYASFLADEWADWFLQEPAGAVTDVWVSRIDYRGGEIDWR